MDRHSRTIAVTIASGTRNLGLRTVCVICLYGGILALAAFLLHKHLIEATS